MTDEQAISGDPVSQEDVTERDVQIDVEWEASPAGRIVGSAAAVFGAVLLARRLILRPRGRSYGRLGLMLLASGLFMRGGDLSFSINRRAKKAELPSGTSPEPAA